MALRKLERRNYGGKSPVSIKYQNLHSFKEELILLCQSIFERRRIAHLHSSAQFTISLSLYRQIFNKKFKTIVALWWVTGHLHLQLILKQD